MTTAAATAPEIDVAGDLEAELAEFLQLQDLASREAATIGTAFSYFPTCCS